VTSKGHIAREEYQSTGGGFIPTPDRSLLGLGPPHWSFKYYGLKSICAECVDLNSRVLRPLTYESLSHGATRHPQMIILFG